MRNIFLSTAIVSIMLTTPAAAQQPLFVAYPPPEHKTTSDRIFLIGSAAPSAEVLVNGQRIERSPAGHFAPTFPLELGENIFTLTHQDQQLQIKVTRESSSPPVPEGMAFVESSLTPTVDIARMPGELICFGAIAPPNATVSVQVGDRTIPLMLNRESVSLPSNLAVLTGTTDPNISREAGNFEGCTTAPQNPTNWGQPRYQLSMNGQTQTQMAAGNIEIVSPSQITVAEVTADAAVARTGPSTNHSRLTPLPKGTRAAVTGREGEWIRLDYGAWIKAEEAQIVSAGIPPRSAIRGVRSRQIPGWTEVLFPLQTAVPVTVTQGDRNFVLTLHNTVAQTDTIAFNDDRLVERMDWRPTGNDQVEYTFHFKPSHQWGYKLRYEGTTLILSLRHPPTVTGSRNQPLAGMRILLDPGHGSSEDLGARGPTGYPEKDVTLIVSKLLRDELQQRGATVLMTREGDDDLWPHDRVEQIERDEPDLALSVHYNALPDFGDAINTSGIGMFWYNPQAHDLSVFLHNYLVQKLNRPSYGVFWNNLALTRPTVTPSILLELGFMINPVEFEWIMDEKEQKKLAKTLADGIVDWFATTR
ncbi:N-acetylmuramoyl-L-alanine amidase [Phormidium pseudopriestleyi FRX01]|uniref:N-acetylmuramoyl-L-alanine amidase n=1 Tax=Phormidium pseudopriestleyi FRX01 TaxID=1759528 RepID=A0ABS3FY29_9CYAN|nr:N-acetylmuramoyl-L-alanine amidase [Phormidium pseudopriestleyi]MBO0352034.1 N-acetylmuramoyl-L-alanine amidase [Phormidium pseudopriestleyi FRX01]